jgi:hypothetical protein
VDWAGNQDCDLHSTAILAQYAYKGIDFYFVVFDALADGAVTIKYGWTPASYIGEYLKAEGQAYKHVAFDEPDSTLISAQWDTPA